MLEGMGRLVIHTILGNIICKFLIFIYYFYFYPVYTLKPLARVSSARFSSSATLYLLAVHILS